jgi:hypothetical protein
MVMSHLALYLLGPPRIERDGVPIQVDTRKAIALLAYIAVTEESHRRASLINLLWPEYDHTRGRAALRRTLYALRKALAGDWVEVDREEIGRGQVSPASGCLQSTRASCVAGMPRLCSPSDRRSGAVPRRFPERVWPEGQHQL